MINHMITSALNRDDIKRLIKKANLIENYLDLEVQLTPNGFDLTAAGVFEFDTGGALDFSNAPCFIN